MAQGDFPVIQGDLAANDRVRIINYKLRLEDWVGMKDRNFFAVMLYGFLRL